MLQDFSLYNYIGAERFCDWIGRKGAELGMKREGHWRDRREVTGGRGGMEADVILYYQKVRILG